MLVLFLLHSCVNSCEPHIQFFERQHGIPSHLLHSVALVESGKMLSKGRKVAWPWTINVEGKGYTFSSKKEAIKVVNQFKAQGKNSIDVGCMQINLKHHPHAFKNLEEAFDPRRNVSYAATFLTELKQQKGSWQHAVAHYHSATPKFHNPYRQKVHQIWTSILNDPQLYVAPSPNLLALQSEMRGEKSLVAPEGENHPSPLIPSKLWPSSRMLKEHERSRLAGADKTTQKRNFQYQKRPKTYAVYRKNLKFIPLGSRSVPVSSKKVQRQKEGADKSAMPVSSYKPSLRVVKKFYSLKNY